VNTQDTSRESLQIYKPKLSHKCAELYHLYRTYGAMTDLEVSEKSGWKINQVTGRRNDLVRHTNTFGKPRPLIEKRYKVYVNGYPSWKWGLIGDGQIRMLL